MNKNAIEACRQLKEQLEAARKTAIDLRDRLGATDPMDVTYIGLALEAVELRLRFYQAQKSEAKT